MGFLHRHEREEHGHATPLYYFHTDAMGTPKLATNEKQQVVWRWNEDAFGATVSAEQDRRGHRDHDRDHGSHDIEVNLRYPGQYYDSETGLFYNWNRYYNPNTGRYSRSDPLGQVAGVNTYAYVEGNPNVWTDPKGLIGPWESSIQNEIEAAIAEGDVEALEGLIDGEGLSPEQEAMAKSGLSRILSRRGLPPDGIRPPVDNPDACKVGEASRPSESAKGGKSLWDENGGEWRYYPEDKWHNPHWDYNPHSVKNSPWENIPIGNLPPRK